MCDLPVIKSTSWAENAVVNVSWERSGCLIRNIDILELWKPTGLVAFCLYLIFGQFLFAFLEELLLKNIAIFFQGVLEANHGWLSCSVLHKWIEFHQRIHCVTWLYCLLKMKIIVSTIDNFLVVFPILVEEGTWVLPQVLSDLLPFYDQERYYF